MRQYPRPIWITYLKIHDAYDFKKISLYNSHLNLEFVVQIYLTVAVTSLVSSLCIIDRSLKTEHYVFQISESTLLGLKKVHAKV